MKLWMCLCILTISVILRQTYAATGCDTKISSSSYVNTFGFTATTEIAGNLAADVFSNGWCAETNNSPYIDVDFKQLLGISGINVSSPTNQGPSVFPRKVLVQYVPNGGSGFQDFPIGSTGKLEMELTHPGSIKTAFGGMSLVAGKLRFIILAYEGSACLKIDLEVCDAADVCQGGCHNGGLCMMTNQCQCAAGFLGQNCQQRECTPEVLGLGDGRIGPDQITVSSEDPPYTKDQIGKDSASHNMGWCASATDQCPFVEVKLDAPKAISVFSFDKIRKQNGMGDLFMNSFELQYIAPTDSSKQFRTYNQIIPAINSTHIFTVSIQPVVVTDTIRIVANQVNLRACFCLEISGCDPKALCSPGYCQNGGTCMGVNICKCPDHFFGSACEQTITDIVATNLTFVNIVNNIITTTSTQIHFMVTGQVTLTTMNNKPVLTISGSNSYTTLNSTSPGSSCINNINQCTNGYTFAVDINFASIVDNTFLVSSGGNLPGHSGVALYYTQHTLHYIVSTSTQLWTLVVNYTPVLNVWQHFEITWSPHFGVEVLVNGVSLGSNSKPQQPPAPANSIVDLCIACSHSTSINVNVNMHVTGVTLWNIDRTELVNAGVLKPPVMVRSNSGSSCTQTTTTAHETTTMVTTTSPILSALTTSLPTTQATLTTSYPNKPITLEDVITVSCTGANWNVTVDMDQLSWLYPFISDKDVFLGQPSCQGESRDNMFLLFQQRFDNPNCLTKEKVVNGMKFYENMIHYAILDPKDPTIIRYHEWSFDVGCLVSNSASTSNHFEHTVNVHNETYTVHQDINIAFYKDPNFLNEFKEPIHLTVGHDVYVKVYVEQPDMNFKMRLHTCYTNPPGQDATRLEHVLINDGCEVDSTTHILSQSTQETRFMFQDYQSVAMESGLDVHCNATFCDINDHSRDCLQVCHKSPSIIG